MVNNENQLNSYDVNPVHQMAQGNHDHAENNQDESEDYANDDAAVSEDNANNPNDTFNHNTSNNQYATNGNLVDILFLSRNKFNAKQVFVLSRSMKLGPGGC